MRHRHGHCLDAPSVHAAPSSWTPGGSAKLLSATKRSGSRPRSDPRASGVSDVLILVKPRGAPFGKTFQSLVVQKQPLGECGFLLRTPRSDKPCKPGTGVSQGRANGAGGGRAGPGPCRDSGFCEPRLPACAMALAGGRRLRLLLTWLLLWPRQTRFPVLQKNQERWDRPERKAWQPSAARNANLTLICFSTDDEKRDRKAAARSPRTDLIQAKYLKYTRPGKPDLADARLRNAQKYKELGSLGRPLPSPVHVAPVTGPS